MTIKQANLEIYHGDKT